MTRALIGRITAGLGRKDERFGQPLYIEKISEGKKHYATSRAFTLALCGEAILSYAAARRKLDAAKIITEKKAAEDKIFLKIKTAAEKRFGSLPRPARSEALRLIRKTLIRDISKNMTLLPYRILLSMEKPETDPKIALLCGTSSLYGWIAYSIYDKIIDEKENPHLLPLANIFHREMCLIFRKTAPSGYVSIMRETLDSMDCAQFCEFKHHLSYTTDTKAKIPTKRQIIDKSLGLMLPSVLTLASVGITAKGFAMKKFMIFFRNFIFVKQLSDDVRDWREDVEKGIATRVTSNYTAESSLISAAQEIIRHCTIAKNALASAGIFLENSFIFGLVDKYANTAREFLKRNSGKNKE